MQSAADRGEAARLWARLALEMREAREAAGVRPSDWGSTPDVAWTRSHLSNLEHGRGKPTPEVAELYDRHFAPEDAPTYFRQLQAAAAEAEADAPTPDDAPGGPAAAATPLPRARRHARPPAAMLVAVAIAGAALGAGVTLWVTKEDDAGGPATGLREVCAEDLVLRESPGKAKGGEPSLLRGDVLDVDRYAPGTGGAHA